MDKREKGTGALLLRALVLLLIMFLMYKTHNSINISLAIMSIEKPRLQAYNKDNKERKVVSVMKEQLIRLLGKSLFYTFDEEACVSSLDLNKSADNLLAEGVAVPVYCKDCKDYKPHGNGRAGVCQNRKCTGLRYATDFCSYGEVKE